MSRYFWPIFTPSPCHTSSHIPGPPRKYVTHLGFRRPSTKNLEKSPLVQILSQLFAGVFVRWILSEGLLSGRFCPGWFLSVPVLLEYISCIRKLNITLNFMFRMYDKKFISVTSHALYPSLCHKLSHLLGPPPPSSVTFVMDGPLSTLMVRSLKLNIRKVYKH